ncbi:MAG TPA: LCP family protein [Oscillatoriaceae cyanobacterium]
MQTPPPLEPPTIPDGMGPTRRAVRRHKRTLWMRRAIAVGIFCVLTAAIGGAIGVIVRWAMPPVKFSLLAPEDTRVNVLVIGADPRALPSTPGDPATHHAADFLQVFSFDRVQHQAVVITVPRETRVLLSDDRMGPIGLGLAQGSTHMTELVEATLGMHVPYYLYLEPGATRSVLDKLGGVSLDLARPLQFTDEDTHAAVNLASGVQKLTPAQVAALAWHDEADDAPAQLAHQQELIEAYQQSIQGMGWGFGAVVDSVDSQLETNLPNDELHALADRWRQVPPDALAFATLPGDLRQGSWIINTQELDGLKQKLKTPLAATQPDRTHPTVEILYGGSDDHKAMALADTLTRQGFQVIRTSRAPIAHVDVRLVDRGRAKQRSQSAIADLCQAVGSARVVIAADPLNPYSAQYTLELGSRYFQ